MLQEVEELFVSQVTGAFPSADTEQVIEVPKILDNTIPQRPVLWRRRWRKSLWVFLHHLLRTVRNPAAGGEANL